MLKPLRRKISASSIKLYVQSVILSETDQINDVLGLKIKETFLRYKNVNPKQSYTMFYFLINKRSQSDSQNQTHWFQIWLNFKGKMTN